MRPIESVLERLPDAKKSGSGWKACCPAHEDHDPSLQLGEGEDGRVLVRCFAGCAVEAICAAIGMRVRDLYPTPAERCTSKNARRSRSVYQSVEQAVSAALDTVRRKRGESWRQVRMFVYRDASDRDVMRVLRFEPPEGGTKTFLPISRTEAGWEIGDPPGQLPLYRVPELAGQKRVCVVEGEGVADLAASCGLTPTTSAHGANCPHKSDWTPLLDPVVEEIVIIPDADGAGRQYAQLVLRILHKLGCTATIKILELPGLTDGDDLVQFVHPRRARGVPEDQIRREIDGLIDRAPRAAAQGPTAETDVPSTRRKHIPGYVPFPVDLIPEPLRAFIKRASESIGCDPAFVALPLLATAASAIGNTRRIRLKRGWSEPSIIWALLVAFSGRQKSPAHGLLVRVIDVLQARALKEFQQVLSKYKDKCETHKVRMKKWSSDGGVGEPPQPPIEPVPDRLYTSDTTVEALAILLYHRWRGLLLLRDELSGWVGSFDQYRQGRGGDAAHWLEMHGARPMLIDRKTGDPRTIHVPLASVSIVGGIQPAVLGRVLGTRHFENGLAARFLLAYPPPIRRVWTETDIPEECEAELLRIFERLYDLQPDTTAEGDPLPREIDLTPEAKKRWITFFNEHGAEQAAMTGDLSAAWSKLEGYAARLALVIHFLRWAAGAATEDPRIDEESVRAGIELSRWFGNEAKRVYQVLRASEEDLELQQLAEMIAAHGGSVAVREWQRKRSHPTTGAAEEELQRLVDARFGAWGFAQISPAGGRPSRLFKLHETDPESETPHVDVPDRVLSEPDAERRERDDGDGGRAAHPEEPGGGSGPDCPPATDRTPKGSGPEEVSSAPKEEGGGSDSSHVIEGPDPSSTPPASDTDKTPSCESAAGVSTSDAGFDQFVSLVEQTFGEGSGASPTEPPTPEPPSPKPPATKRRSSSQGLPFDGIDDPEVRYD